MSIQRDAFEAWYCADAAQHGFKMKPEEIAALREGDTYGAKRVALNSKWEGWQATGLVSWRPIADLRADPDTMVLAKRADGAMMVWSSRILAHTPTPAHLDFQAVSFIPCAELLTLGDR